MSTAESRRKVNLVVDMFGCPNRCRHCWLGHIPHQTMEKGADEWIVSLFRPYFDKIAFYSWMREPDLTDDYEARWERDKAISVGTIPERFELASFYRLCRDENYGKFLKKIGVEAVQLTFFGMEDMTDRYVGRKGAFRELLSATESLLKNGIAPRYQAFIYEENKDDLLNLRQWIRKTGLEERCTRLGLPFTFFVHEGSCDGENRKLYPIRIHKQNIPPELIPYYNGYDSLMTEEECCALFRDESAPFVYHNSSEITLNITSDASVYYNFTEISQSWRIGNLKTDNTGDLMRRILTEDTFALNAARRISVGELVKRYGDSHSHRVFSPEDYKAYLLNNYLDSLNPMGI